MNLRAEAGGIMADQHGFTDRMAEGLVERLITSGIQGIGPFDPAEYIATRALTEHPDVEEAIDQIISSHLKMAGVSGFVTGLGGFLTMIAALPANVVGFYTIATRMVAAIAHLRGEDLSDPETQTAVMLTLTGDDASNLLAKAGATVPGTRATTMALRRLPASTLTFVNKGIGFKLFAQTVGKGAARFGRAIPIVGGLVGATIDLALMRSIAKHARREFPATPARV